MVGTGPAAATLCGDLRPPRATPNWACLPRHLQGGVHLQLNPLATGHLGLPMRAADGVHAVDTGAHPDVWCAPEALQAATSPSELEGQDVRGCKVEAL